MLGFAELMFCQHSEGAMLMGEGYSGTGNGNNSSLYQSEVVW